MPRPRFDKLPQSQRDSILSAAVDEFAAHGYGNASLNRIINVAGLSKGSMYYYFDGKDDLYAHVIRAQVEDLFSREGPFPVPQGPDPEAFWATLTDYYLRLLRLLIASPTAAALLRDWITASAGAPIREAVNDAEQDMLPWLTQTLTAGQRIGAIRTDLPADLIISVAMAIGQALDIWLIGRVGGENDLADLVGPLMDLLRRAVAPD
jgi:AcrR family transcriptional regulator